MLVYTEVPWEVPQTRACCDSEYYEYLILGYSKYFGALTNFLSQLGKNIYKNVFFLWIKPLINQLQIIILNVFVLSRKH